MEMVTTHAVAFMAGTFLGALLMALMAAAGRDDR